MTPDHHHNLVQQLSELMDSVWRYDKHYKEDSKDCPQCVGLWDNLHKRHEEDIANLKKHIADHVKQGDW